MHIRNVKKYSGDISLQEPMGVDLEGNEITLEDKLADENSDIVDQVSTGIQIRRLKRIIGRILAGRERNIIEKRYGLGGEDEVTQREIASELGISRSYVSRIEKKTLRKLKAELTKPSTEGED